MMMSMQRIKFTVNAKACGLKVYAATAVNTTGLGRDEH
jgi:hypothetical protein